MELSELAAYAAEKYNISEEYRWAEAPGISVLSHPVTGKYIALLIRTAVNGRKIELCDIRCGSRALSSADYIYAPFSMKGDEWVGVRIDGRTDAKTVFSLIDKAIVFGGQNGCMIVLGSDLGAKKEYTDTPLRFAGRPQKTTPDRVPERIREMKRRYEYGYESFQNSCRNFYIQGKYMEDYEDDAPWTGEFRKYFPTYHDLTTEQLRGYFTWRTAVRRGEYSGICTSFAYIYIYELINGIGAVSAEDSLEKLEAFERGFLDSGKGDAGIRNYLHTWMTELAVVSGLPAETAARYADKAMLQKDAAYDILKNSREHTDDEVYDALLIFSGKMAASPLMKKYPDRMKHLYAEVWRYASSDYRENGKKLFSLCFGECRPSRWYPLRNAVYYERYDKADRTFELDVCRTYIQKNGEWSVKCYKPQNFDKKRFEGLLHETERRLRIFFGEGNILKERPENRWAADIIEAVIDAYRQQQQKLAEKKITIRFDDLDKIRRDALYTQDCLLIGEETEEDIAADDIDTPMSDINSDDIPGEMYDDEQEIIPGEREISVPLDDRQLQILDMLLEGMSVKSVIRSWGEMAEIFAERINEVLFDEIGDTVVECDGDDIVMIEDYRDDIVRITGGRTE